MMAVHHQLSSDLILMDEVNQIHQVTAKLHELLTADESVNFSHLKELLSCGGDANKIIGGVSAFHLAAGRHVHAVKLLLLFGGDPNIVSDEHVTPLHVAASWGHLDILRLLISNGADVSISDQEGKTALDQAQEEGHDACAAVLKQHIMLDTVEVEDNALSPKYIVDRKSFYEKGLEAGLLGHKTTNKEIFDCLDNSIIHPKTLSNAYTARITQKLFNQLEQGKLLGLDVTSPDTPLLRTKRAHSSRQDMTHCTRVCDNTSPCCRMSSPKNIPVNLQLSCTRCRDYHSPSYDYHSSEYDYRNPSCDYHSSEYDYHNPSYDYHSSEYDYHNPSYDYHSSEYDYHNSGYDIATDQCHSNACPARKFKNYRNNSKHNEHPVVSPTFTRRHTPNKQIYPEINGRHNGCNSNYKHETYPHNYILRSHIPMNSAIIPKMTDHSHNLFDHSHTISPSFKSSNLESSHPYHSSRTLLTNPSSPHKQSQVFPECSCCSPSKSTSIQKNHHYRNERCTAHSYSSFKIIPTSNNSKNDVWTEPCKHLPDSKKKTTFRKQPIQSSLSPNVIKRNLPPKTSLGTDNSTGKSPNSHQDAPSNYALKHEQVSLVTSKSLEKQRECKDSCTVLNGYFTHNNAQEHYCRSTKTNSFSNKYFSSWAYSGSSDSSDGEIMKSALNMKSAFLEALNESICQEPSSNKVIDSNNVQSKKLTASGLGQTGTNTETAGTNWPASYTETDKDWTLPHSDPQERTAKFVLSLSEPSSNRSSFKSHSDPQEHLKNAVHSNTSGIEGNKVSNNDNSNEIKQKVEDPSFGSSADSFATCENDASDTTVFVRDISNKLSVPSSSAYWLSPGFSTDKTKKSASKWKAPLPTFQDNEDLLTSDDSFARVSRSPRIYRMKMKPGINVTQKQALSSEFIKPVNTVKQTYARNDQIKGTGNAVEKVSEKERMKEHCKRMSAGSDSLFSTISVRETVYRDPQRGIVLLEMHIPSDSGGSVGRRSLDSVLSAVTVESQSTLIYDWRMLHEISKSNLGNKEPTKSFVKHSYAHKVEAQIISSTPRSSFSPQDNNLVDCEISAVDSNNTVSTSHDSSFTGNSGLASVPPHLESLSNEQLSQKLHCYGEIPGPVVPSTRQVYLRRLASLESNPGLVCLTKDCPAYPPELRQAFNEQFDSSGMSDLEVKMIEAFNTTNGRQWREGKEKSSFTYLLLDPRITENLPLRSKDMSDQVVLKTFICSIFYVGKGKRARPYSHLYEAVSKRDKNTSVQMSKKVKHIVDIWNAGTGVVSLHCFQSVIPVEAYTREACMLEAIGLHKVTNMKRGDYYGLASTWSMVQRRRMGVYLLQKALQIFLAEGERQICIPDLKSSQ